MKKTKVILVVLLFFVIQILSHAQTPTMTWGKAFSNKLLNTAFRVTSIDEKGMTLLAPVPAFMGIANSMALLKFDAGMNYLSTVKIPLKSGDKTLEYEFIVRMKNHTLVFSSYNDLKESKKKLFYQEFDEGPQKLASEATLVLDMPIIKKPMPVSGTYFYALSPDSANLAIVYNPPSAGGAMESYGFAVIDNSLKLVSKRTEEFSFKDRYFDMESIEVSVSGNIFLSGTFTTGPRNPVKKEPNYKYMIIMVGPEGTEPKEISIELGKQFITDMQIGGTPDNKLVAAGFYSDEGKFSIKGCFSYTLNAETGEITHQSSKDFPIDLITAGMREKQAERTEDKAGKGKNVEMENYDLDHLVVRSDNGMYLVAEQFYSVTTTSYSSNGTTTQHTTYYANSIIVVGINAEGEIDMTQKVLKKQHSSSSSDISYVLSVSGSDLYFFFTDNPINNAPYPQKVENALYGRTGIVTLAGVNTKGEVTRNTLYKFDKNTFYPLPYLCQPLDKGKVLLGASNKFKTRFCMVKLEQ